MGLSSPYSLSLLKKYNMIRLRDIQKALFPLVGWTQHYNPSKAIDERLTNSESGNYFQAEHPLLTLENLAAIMPLDYTVKFPEYHEAKEYAADDKVRSGGEVWQALLPSLGQLPTLGSDYWSVYNPVSDYLEALTNEGIAAMCKNFVKEKTLSGESKQLLERKAFFDGAGRLSDRIENKGRICGYEIRLKKSMGITAKVERIGLQFDGAVGELKVYLFHSSQKDPLKTTLINLTSQKIYQWFNLSEWFLPYISDNNSAGGAFYIVYSQNDLHNVEAINIAKDWQVGGCNSCGGGSTKSWRELSHYMSVMPFKVSAPNGWELTPELWDIERNIYTNATNYGVNLEMSLFCDLTDFIISQRHIFTDVLAKEVAAMGLRKIAMNSDALVSRKQLNASRMDILYEIDGNTQGRAGGLGYELKRAYEALKLDTKGIDKVCLSCNRNGVRYTVT